MATHSLDERRRRRLLVAVALLVGALVAVGAATARTAAGQEAPDCGDEISQDTTLAADLGPCEGAGLIAVADGVTLDLNSHTIAGDPEARGGQDHGASRCVGSTA